MPFHSIEIPYIGLPLLDNTELDTLSKTCQKEERWELELVAT